MDAAGEAARRLSLSGGTPGATALRGFLAAWLLGCGLHGLALEPITPLANYGRQSWGMENGLPQNTVQALVQTRDGFVWLGTEVGLVRFDGNSFAVFDKNSTPALPGNDVRCLLETHDGALWIGTSEGLARWKDGIVTAFTTRDGLPGNGILEFWETRDGVLMMWTDLGIAQQTGERFVKARNVDAWPHTALPSPGEPPGQVEFEEGLPNDVFMMGDRSTLTLVKGPKPPGIVTHLTVGKELPGSRIQDVFADREGSLWIGTNGGLARWVAGKVQRLPVTDPLATASILSLMEDHEGNLWVGTETGGLHILRDQRFRTIGAREGSEFRCNDHGGGRQDRNALGGNQRKRAECPAPEWKWEQRSSLILGAQRPVERRDSVSGRRAQRRPLGGHAGRTEPDSRRQDRCLYLGGRAAGRLYPFAAGRRRWLAVDWHAARADALDWD